MHLLPFDTKTEVLVVFCADQARAKARANGDKNKANVKKAIGLDKRKNFERSFT